MSKKIKYFILPDTAALQINDIGTSLNGQKNEKKCKLIV